MCILLVGTWQVLLLVVSSCMANHGPCHRRGAPGGPGAQVSILPISGRASASNRVIEASLLDAGQTGFCSRAKDSSLRDEIARKVVVL